MRPIVTCLAVLPCMVALAAQSPQSPSRTAAEPRIRIDHHGIVLPAAEIGVEELIAAAARYLQRNIGCDPTELTGAATNPLRLQKELALDALGCEDMLSQLLATRGLALVPTDADRGLYQVVRIDGPRQAEIADNALRRSPEEILLRPQLHVYVMTAVPLEHVDAAEAAKTLRTFFAVQPTRAGPMVHLPLAFGAMGGGQTLLIAGFQDQVATALGLVRACDRPNRRIEPSVDARLGQIETLLQKVARVLWPEADGTKN